MNGQFLGSQFSMDSSDADTMNRRHQRIADRSHTPQMNPGEVKRARVIRKKRKNEIISLPEAILFNIFVWLPANVLYHRVRYVCRQWDKIVRDPYFIKEHLRRARSCLFIQYYRPPSPPDCIELEAMDAVVTKLRYRFPTTVLASCDGLLMYPDPKDESILHIANPVTKKGLTLPPISWPLQCGTPISWPLQRGTPISWPLRRSIYSISCARPSGEYKVVCTNCLSPSFMCMILSLGKDCKWRQIDAPNLRVNYGLVDNSLSAGGFVYWAHRDLDSFAVLDVETELFYEYPLTVHNECKFVVSFAVLGDNLSYMIRRNYILVMDVWVLSDPKTGSWRKLYRLDLEGQPSIFRRRYNCKYACRPFLKYWMRPVAWMNHGEVFVFSFGLVPGPFIAYNVKTKVISAFGNYKSCWGFDFCHAHVNSLVSLTPLG